MAPVSSQAKYEALFIVEVNVHVIKSIVLVDTGGSLSQMSKSVSHFLEKVEVNVLTVNGNTLKCLEVRLC